MTPFDGLHKAIKGYGLKAEDFMRMYGCSRTTALKKLRHPEDELTIRQYRDLHRKGHIPAEELKFDW